VLLEVGRRDREQRSVGGEGIGMVGAWLVVGGGLADPAQPGRDGAVGVAGLDRAERGEVATEPGDQVGRRRGLQGQREGAGQERDPEDAAGCCHDRAALKRNS
jgi:hypothetical protein